MGEKVNECKGELTIKWLGDWICDFKNGCKFMDVCCMENCNCAWDI